MFDITPLEYIHGAIFLLGLLAKGGLIAGIPLTIDQIVAHASGEHIIPLILAAITWLNINYFRRTRPMFYSGKRRMPMSIDRAKARAQREIDAVYEAAWFHNVAVDLKASQVSWNWL